MIRKQLVIPVALLTSFALTPVIADQSGDQGGSKAERQQEQMGKQGSTSNPTFDELDRNQDGKLDEDELNTWGSTAAGPNDDQKGSERGERLMERYDRDGDGAVSEEELEQQLNEGTGTGTGSGATSGDKDI